MLLIKYLIPLSMFFIGKMGNKIVDDNATIKEIQEIVKTFKSDRNPKFDAVISMIQRKLKNGSFWSRELSGGFFCKKLDRDREFEKLQAELTEKDYLNEDPAMEMDTEKGDAGSRESITCAITLEEIKDIYIMEASYTGKGNYKELLIKNIDKIRQFPWSVFKHLPVNNASWAINVLQTPYKIESFFQMNENKVSSNQLFASLYNFTSTSFVLIHRGYKMSENDLNMFINLNYMFAINFFFNDKPGKTQVQIGKKFEIVYIYMMYLSHCLKSRNAHHIYLMDIEYTLEYLEENSHGKIKMPQFSIYYSLKLFKRILTESKLLEPISDPVTISAIRETLEIKSQIHTDSILKFIHCLMWLHTGECPNGVLPYDREKRKTFFKEALGFDVPSKPWPSNDIFKMILRKFIKFIEPYEGVYLFLNELEEEQAFYFNGLPLNFIKYLLIALNQPNLNLNSKVSSSDNRNIDNGLATAYSPNYVYKVKFANLLYKIPVSEEPRIQVCWTTMRPQTFFPDEKMWSEFCPALDKTKTHHDRLRECDSLHLSLFKQYQLHLCEKETIPDLESFIRYLSHKFQFKTFSKTVMIDAEDVVNIYKNIFKTFENDVKAIKKRIRLMLDMSKRKKYEAECCVPQCYHAEAGNSMVREFVESVEQMEIN